MHMTGAFHEFHVECAMQVEQWQVELSLDFCDVPDEQRVRSEEPDGAKTPRSCLFKEPLAIFNHVLVT